jgi:hypothetical protein
MFAEDIGLLPNRMFSRMIDHAKARPEHFDGMGALSLRRNALRRHGWL